MNEQKPERKIDSIDDSIDIHTGISPTLHAWGHPDDRVALPFVWVDDTIIYLHRYDGFVIAESHCWGEWLDFSIMGRKDGKWHSVGLCYGHRPLYGGYDRETSNFLIQAGMTAIKVALEKWNERGTS